MPYPNKRVRVKARLKPYSAAAEENQDADMLLTSWNVWHNYSTYFLENIDLSEAAVKLVSSGLCVAVYQTNDVVYWKCNGKVESGDVVIDRLGRAPRASVRPPVAMNSKEFEGRRYILECTLQATRARFHEMKNLSVFVLRDVPYIRGFLEPFRFKQGESWVVMYPQIKLFHNGVCTLSLRIISPEQPVTSDELIDRYINLFRFNTDEIELPPDLMISDATNVLTIKATNPFLRYRIARALRQTKGHIKHSTRIYETDDFSFEIAPADPDKILKEPELNIDAVLEYTFSAINAALDSPRTGARYVLFNQKARKHIRGDYWSGRANVHIMRFENQPDTALEIREKYKWHLLSILNRTPSYGTTQLQPTDLPESLRLFDDVSIHINEAIGLYVHSKRINKLLEQLITPDPNYDEVLYEKQVQAELMDYVRMSYKKLEELSSTSLGQSRIDDIFAEREMLFKLNALLNKLVNSGELKNLLDKAWEQFSIANSRELVLANTEIKLEKVRERRETKFRNFGLLVSVIFGLVSLPTLSQDIILPTWLALGWWSPVKVWQPAFFLTITTVLVAVTISVILLPLTRKP